MRFLRRVAGKVGERLSLALLGSTLWWVFEHLTDRLVEQFLGHLGVGLHL